MRNTPVLVIISVTLLCGCATQKTPLRSEGKGLKSVYAADFDSTWRAALNAARHGELKLVSADESLGVVQARTDVRMESWGEYVAVWVRKLSSGQTEVEVVSRHGGPAGLFSYNWERPILTDIAVELHLPPPNLPPIQKLKAGKQ
jgi:hypothetical protein